MILRLVSTGCRACLAVLLLAFAVMAQAGDLQGLVIGKDGSPRAYIRMDFSGPTRATVVTDTQGQYWVSLPDGAYTVRLSDQKHRQKSSVSVSGSGKSHDFRLRW